jgi:hypothetical protein
MSVDLGKPMNYTRVTMKSFVGFEVLITPVMKSSTFWDVVSHIASWWSTDVSVEHVTPTFRVKEWAKQETMKKEAANRALLATCFMLISCSANSSALKMEVTCSSEMSVNIQLTIWCYIPEDRTLHKIFVFKTFLFLTCCNIKHYYYY